MRRGFVTRALRGQICWLRIGLHLAVIAGLILALGVAQVAEGYFPRGVAAGNDLDPIPHTAVNPMGVNTFFDREADPAVIERSMDMIAEAGFGYMRQIFGWFDIEPEEKGVYRDRFGEPTWPKFDRIVALAEERDLEIIARLEKPPRWARAGQPNLEQFPDGPPNRIEDWVDYVEAVATRYEGRINYYQLWNEPNLTGEWGGLPIDPEHYVELLRAGYEAIKRVDPDATVILAGLAPTEQRGPVNLSDLIFLQQVYDYGGKDYFDIVAAMVYGYGYSPYDRRVSFERNNFSRVIQTREIMVRNGDANKPIWAVEYGWVALPDDWAGEPSPWGEPVSYETQAEYLVDGYLRAQEEWPWMGVMAVWTFRFPLPPDHPDQIANPTRGFALVEHDFSPRPAYEALKLASTTIQRLGTGAYLAGDAMRDRLSRGNPVTLLMRGERLDLRFDGGGGGQVEVTLNGHSTRTLDIPSGPNSVVTVARDLPDGNHDITLRQLSEPTDDPPVLEQYTISRLPLQTWIYPWIDALLALLILVNVASLGWAVWDWRRARRTIEPPAFEEPAEAYESEELASESRTT